MKEKKERDRQKLLKLNGHTSKETKNTFHSALKVTAIYFHEKKLASTSHQGKIMRILAEGDWRVIRLSGHLGSGFCIFLISKRVCKVPSKSHAWGSASSRKDTLSISGSHSCHP